MLWPHYALAVCLLLAHACSSSRILGIFPMPASSHQHVMTALAKGLANNGHDVTVVTPIPLKSPPKNYKEIVIEHFFKKLVNPDESNLYDKMNMSPFIMMVRMWWIGNALCEMSLQDPNMQPLIQSKESYDLIIIEAFYNECFLGFAHKFQAPVIQVSPIGSAETVGDSTGNPTPYSYISDFILSYGDHMSFPERLHNTLVGVLKSLGRTYYYLPKQDAIIKKHFNNTGPGPIPHVSELNARTSMVLLNNHVSIHYPRPYLPSVIEVGGMHINPPKKLPQDLQKYMDDAKEGVIYFSMGSNLKSSDLPEEKRDALLQTFSKLKQKVLWKWETDTMPGQPANVKLSKWFPQADLLAHPNVRLFITHGGLLSTQEAVYHGVPIIGIPIFGDQPLNMRRSVAAGFAVQLDFQDVSPETVTGALREVLDNPRYTETARRMSRTFRDQPRTPLETAIFWTEYVLRHKGASHMRSAALDLCWFQYHLLDVLAVLGAGALTLLALLYLFLRTLCRCVLPAKKKPVTSASKKKN